MSKFFAKKRNYLLPFVLFLIASSSFSKLDNSRNNLVSDESGLYQQLQLSQLGLSQAIFMKAITGWKALFEKKQVEKPLLSIADLTQSSNSKRLYVIDMEQRKVLFNTYVAHGRNSGEEYANSFSNRPNSYKTSLGFYVTQNTYEGSHGLSMKLSGIEEGINDGAEQRGIVMHGAPYVSESFINQFGRLGRSQGCPAVPEELCKPIINSIKGGSCFFMFYPDSSYLKKTILI